MRKAKFIAEVQWDSEKWLMGKSVRSPRENNDCMQMDQESINGIRKQHKIKPWFIELTM